MKTARDIMTPEVYAVTEMTSLQTLSKLLRDHEISGVPVLNQKGWPVGVVSMYDLVYQGGAESDPELPVSHYWNSGVHLPRGYHELKADHADRSVKDIMTPAVYAVEEDTPLSVVCEFFLRGKIHRVLVTREGALCGIITSTDLIAEFHSLITGTPEITLRILSA